VTDWIGFGGIVGIIGVGREGTASLTFMRLLDAETGLTAPFSCEETILDIGAARTFFINASFNPGLTDEGCIDGFLNLSGLELSFAPELDTFAPTRTKDIKDESVVIVLTGDLAGLTGFSGGEAGTKLATDAFFSSLIGARAGAGGLVNR
jgi:hypothetical protein